MACEYTKWPYSNTFHAFVRCAESVALDVPGPLLHDRGCGCRLLVLCRWWAIKVHTLKRATTRDAHVVCLCVYKCRSLDHDRIRSALAFALTCTPSECSPHSPPNLSPCSAPLPLSCSRWRCPPPRHPCCSAIRPGTAHTMEWPSATA